MTTVGNKPSLHSVAPNAQGGTALTPALERSLIDSGLAKPGQSPADVARALLGGLQGKGFEAPPGAGKDLASQLTAALRAFQQAQGLPQTGKLDGATAEALKNLLAPTPSPRDDAQRAAKDGFERGAPTLLKQGEKSRAELAKNSTPDTNFLDALLNKLGGDQGVTADRQGQVGGAAETRSDAKAAAQADAAKETKRVGDADHKTGSTTAEAKKSPREESNQQLDRAKESKVQVARGLRAEQTRTEEQRRKDALFGKDPTSRGILDDEADEDDDAGDGGDGKKRGRGGDQNAGGHGGTDSQGGGGERDGDEKWKGNASSGDDDHGDPRRGHASVDDGSGADAGHYRVASLSEQAFAALQKIAKDPTEGHKATTYSWDVTFFKPGVYGPGQKAQELVHLVVNQATAFDPVWQKAQANLQAMVRRIEKDAPVPTLDDIVQALRQARARDGDKEAVTLGKLRRPLGRA